MNGERATQIIGITIAAILSLCACALIAALTVAAVRALLH